MNRYKIIFALISVFLVITFNVVNPLTSSKQKNGTNNSDINVLIYMVRG